MNDSTRDDIAGQIAQVAERLMADLQSSAPTVPPEVVLAYQDGQVQERILDRLAGGGKLRRVEPLIPDIVLRVRRAFFEFEDQSQLPHATVTGFLVMMDDSNEVTEIIDPFELTKLWLSAVTADNVLTLSSIAQPEMRPAEDTGAFQAFAEREGMSAVFQRFNDQPGVPAGGMTTTWKDVTTATIRNSGSDTQTDQQGTLDRTGFMGAGGGVFI